MKYSTNAGVRMARPLPLPLGVARWQLYWIPLLCYLAVTAIIFGGVWIINNGLFSYVLDDPYIHMALSENILRGHYGVNLEEPSAASSSVLWPYLLAIMLPITGALSPLFINVMCGVALLLIYLSVITRVCDRPRRIVVTTVLLMLLTNLVPLNFIGMEHSLHALISCLCLLGLMRFIETQEISLWWLLALIAGPLLRYEGIALTAPILGYLILQKHWLKPIIAGTALALILLLFSYYLHSLGLDYLPTSLQAKSDHATGSGILAILKSIVMNMIHPAGFLYLIGMGLLAHYARISAHPESKRHLAWVILAATSLHFIFGDMGWYGRYEIYMTAPMLLTLISLYGIPEQLFHPSQWRLLRWPLRRWQSITLLVIAGHYLFYLCYLPLGMNNIYKQQYQLHRFVTEFWQRPVAVNDLGWISFRNDQYVLDLWGLASTEALHQRTLYGTEQPEWMHTLVRQHDVALAIIYSDNPWFFQDVPTQWTKMGELGLGEYEIGLNLGGRWVSFYATDHAAETDIAKQLQRFQQTLPSGTRLVISD